MIYDLGWKLDKIKIRLGLGLRLGLKLKQPINDRTQKK
jgi:hypothetical protein